MTEEVNFDIWD